MEDSVAFSLMSSSCRKSLKLKRSVINTSLRRRTFAASSISPTPNPSFKVPSFLIPPCVSSVALSFSCHFLTIRFSRFLVDYSCSLRGSIVGGRLYITQNYICYQEKLPARIVPLPLLPLPLLPFPFISFSFHSPSSSSFFRKRFRFGK